MGVAVLRFSIFATIVGSECLDPRFPSPRPHASMFDGHSPSSQATGSARPMTPGKTSAARVSEMGKEVIRAETDVHLLDVRRQQLLSRIRIQGGGILDLATGTSRWCVAYGQSCLCWLQEPR